jgi:acetylornithine deacetylase/succinyl-diaminopimelate desuccinylase-like protein
LPVHITKPSKIMVEATASALGGIHGFLFRQLNNPLMTKIILKLLGTNGNTLYPLFHNTVSPTMIHGSTVINVIPGKISIDMDGRLLPGFKPEEMIDELRQIVGQDVTFELIKFDSGPPEPDMGLYNVLSQIMLEADPEGVPVPFILSGVTDGRFFSQLGIQTYGFLPMPLPEDFNFAATLHAENERVPANAIEFGTNVLFKVLQNFGQGD